MSRVRAGLAAVSAVAGLAACTASRPPAAPATSAPTTPATSEPTTPATSASASTTSADRPACPRTYAAPDPARPRMTVRFDIGADHRHVTGREHVVLTPDRPITELVFRLTANSPTPAAGTRTRTAVTAASADHGAGRFTVTRAGAAGGTQGGLLHVPLSRPVAAGTRVSADVQFTLYLGDVAPQAFPRYGSVGGYAYFGSGAPLLAWQRGYGWHTEPLVGFPAETATSEAMALDLTVRAPAGDVVIASGDPAPGRARAGIRTWHATLATARDVSVAAGPFADTSVAVGAVTLHLGAYTAEVRDRLVPQFRRAITELVRRYGPFPFPSLSVARVPVGGGGIEYPGSILMLDDSRAVAVHETAHQWFYAMVGDSQALHPWLDEAFAQYSEELVDGAASHGQDLRANGAVDQPVAAYGTDAGRYYFLTYDKGAAALEAARAAVGPARWDAAVRCYVAANAWRIATPADLTAALRDLPEAMSVLRNAGALR